MAKVLLADDSITMQKVIELVLAGEGFEVKTVSNGGAALASVSSFKPDIVIADIEMPELNGYELSEKIKSDPETKGIPVILLAGAFEPLDEGRVRISGADDTLIKPFESSDLIEKINNLLSVRVAEEGAAEEEIEALAAQPVTVEEGEELWDLAEEAVEAEAVEEALEAAGPEEAVSEEALAEEEAWQEGISEEPPKEAVCEEPEEAPASKAVGEMPTAEEFSGAFRAAVNERLSEFLSTVDMKGMLIEALQPSIKDSVEKILWELTPDLTEKLLKETLAETMSSLKKELENVIWETVPDLAESIIRKEIEKIRAESV